MPLTLVKLFFLHILEWKWACPANLKLYKQFEQSQACSYPSMA